MFYLYVMFSLIYRLDNLSEFAFCSFFTWSLLSNQIRFVSLETKIDIRKLIYSKKLFSKAENI